MLEVNDTTDGINETFIEIFETKSCMYCSRVTLSRI
jgi:hypothetical protein